MAEPESAVIVWVDDALFESGAAPDVDRLALLRNAAQRRHTLVVSESPDRAFTIPIRPYFDTWFDGLPDALREEIRALCDRLRRISANAVTRGARRLRTSDAPTGVWHVRLADAVRVAALPLSVLVENVINDAEFLRQAMPRSWRRRIIEWEESGQLRFENGGGITVMSDVVEAFTHEDRPLAQREEWVALHVVIYDHDGQQPNKPGQWAAKLDRLVEAADFVHQVHRLQRKKQEYYLPREALREIVEANYGPGSADCVKLLDNIDKHFKKPPGQRHFCGLPSLGRKGGEKGLFKNGFRRGRNWPDAWYEADGSWPEMRRIAEMIAAAM